MADKELTPEEKAAKAKEEAAQVQAAANAQEMSGGAVKPAPKPDAASQGVSAMQKYVAAPLTKAYSMVTNPLGSAVDNLKGLYNSVAADPNAAPYDPALPKAKANFWEQAPAALSDVGNYASKALRSAGDSVSGVLNNFAPYTYLRDANKAVGDYFTPSFMQESAAAEEGAKTPSNLFNGVKSWKDEAYPEDPRGEQSFMDAVRGKSENKDFEAFPMTASSGPTAAQQLQNGKYQREIYGPDGTYRGTATGTMEQMDRVARPSSFELQNRAKQQVDDNVQRNLFAQQAKQDREYMERTSPKASAEFFARAGAERELQNALNRGASSDPARNAFQVEDILNSARNSAQRSGQSPEAILSSPKYRDNRNARIALGILSDEAATGRRLTTQEIGQQAFAMSPSSAVNYSNDGETYQQAVDKQFAVKNNPAVASQSKAEAEANSAQNASANLEISRAKLEAAQKEDASQEALRTAQTENLALKQQSEAMRAVQSAQNAIGRLVGQRSKLDPNLNPDGVREADKQIAESRAVYEEAKRQARSMGIEIEAPAEETAESVAPTTQSATKVVDGKTYIQQNGKWFGPI